MNQNNNHRNANYERAGRGNNRGAARILRRNDHNDPNLNNIQDQPQNQVNVEVVDPEAARDRERQRNMNNFTSGSLSRLVCKNFLGKQAMEYLPLRYPNLQLHNNLETRQLYEHDHAYCAFIRALANQWIRAQYDPARIWIDIGAHLYRNVRSDWTNSTLSIAPIVDWNDGQRHMNWQQKLQLSGDWPVRNHCQHKVNMLGVCRACTQLNLEGAPILSVDSIYYPGVLEGIQVELIQGRAPVAYVAFHDYAQTIKQGVNEGRYFDDEGKWKYENFKIKVEVRGNDYGYEHKVLNTERQSWTTRYGGDLVQHSIVQRWKMGDHDYVVMKMTRGTEGYEPPEPPLDNAFLTYKSDIGVENLVISASVTMSETLIRAADCLTFSFREILKSLVNLAKTWEGREKIEFDLQGDEVIVRIYNRKTVNEVCDNTWRFKLAHFKKALPMVSLKKDASGVMSVVRAIAFDGVDYDEYVSIHAAVTVACLLTARENYKTLEVVENDVAVTETRSIIKNNLFTKTSRFQGWGFSPSTYVLWRKIKTSFKEIYNVAWHYLVVMGIVLLLTQIIEVTSNSGNFLHARAHPLYPGVYDKSSDIFQFGSLNSVLLISAIITIIQLTYKKARSRRKLKTVCVRDNKRLQINKMKLWKFSNEHADVKSSGQFNEFVLECKKNDTVGALQIGQFYQPKYKRYDPTVIHNCAKTVLAASVRACSNEIQPDTIHVLEWAAELHAIFNELKQGLILEETNVSVDKWLSKYPIKYRHEMMKVMENPEWMIKDTKTYRSFPKIELQFTDVVTELRDTEENTVKERQISGPSAEKKIFANGFFNELERVADKHVKGYCGSKNWDQIASFVNQMEEERMEPKFCFSDGSGFDMTQTRQLLNRFNTEVQEIIEGKFVAFCEPLGGNMVMKALLDSIDLKVIANNGSIKYVTEGRASGDGWTTFGNTMLMLSYWRYTMKLAGIKRHQYSMLVKGDDVLLCIENKDQGKLRQAVQEVFWHKNEAVRHGLGQVCKDLTFGSITDGTFLSAMFFRTSRGLRMTRIPKRVIQSHGWSIKALEPGRNPDELLYSKGMCLWAWAGDLPIWRAIAQKSIMDGKECDWKLHLEHGDIGRYVENRGISDSRNYMRWLEDRFDITRNEVADLEELILSSDKLEDIRHPVFDKLYMDI